MKKTVDSMNAVLYCRYSSHSQSEQSIEGQLRDNYAFAERCGYAVVGEYIDRALTGKSDDRPEFQRLMKDAEKRLFSVVIVWKLDRFSRNRYDSAIYKQHLKKYGVRVVSVMENITDSPEGIILEGLLESMAEYYSANLAENIRRGQKESIAKGWFCGGPVPWGYRVVDHKLVQDEKTAPLVRELYQRYAAGEGLSRIAEDFNARGYRTRHGKLFSTSTFDRIVPNSTYIGEHVYAGEVIPNLAEPLIDRDLYDKAALRRQANRRAPAANRAPVRYALQGRVFCGYCGAPMCGDFGTSKSGASYHYYSCSAKKHRKRDCRKKSERKDFIEWYICEQTVAFILDPARLSEIASAVVALYNAEIDQTRIRELEASIPRLDTELNTLVDRLIYVPKEGAPRIGEKIQQLELQRADTEIQLSKARLQQRIPLSEKEVAAWLKTFSRGDLFDDAFRAQLIDTFIACVYLYNDKVVIFFNLKGAKQVCGIDEISELDEKIPVKPCSTLTGNGGAYHGKVEHCFVVVHGMIGLVVFRE